MKLCHLGVAVIALVCAVSAAEASPRHRHPHHESLAARQCVPDNSGHMTCSGAEKRTQRVRIEDANGNGGEVVGGRPHGCPYQFCGCEASIYLFGKIVPTLNLASNWIRRFPRAHPAPGMAAARNHHVMVLMRHVSGRDWLVHDGNSGSHMTHEHIRSIAGFVIVDPRPRLALQ